MYGRERNIGEYRNIRGCEKIEFFRKVKEKRDKPISGLRILITRAKEEGEEFRKILSEKGAKTIEFPMICFSSPKSWKKLDFAIKNIKDFDWIIFTSRNGVKFFFKRFFSLNKKYDLSLFDKIKFAVIGTGTKETLEKYGIRTDIVPEEFCAEGIVDAFRGISILGKRILIPRAKIARDILPIELKKMGAIVFVAPAYEVNPVSSGGEKIITLLKEKKIDWITFTSSSTVMNFLSLIGKRNLVYLKGVRLASIGPVTSETLVKAGLSVSCEARIHTAEGLASAIIKKIKAICR